MQSNESNDFTKYLFIISDTTMQIKIITATWRNGMQCQWTQMLYERLENHRHVNNTALKLIRIVSYCMQNQSAYVTRALSFDTPQTKANHTITKNAHLQLYKCTINTSLSFWFETHTLHAPCVVPFHSKKNYRHICIRWILLRPCIYVRWNFLGAYVCTVMCDCVWRAFD